MNLIKVRSIGKSLEKIGIVSKADVTYNDKADIYLFDFGKIQLQVKNIFDSSDEDETVLMDFLGEVFQNMHFLLEETIKLQTMFDTQTYSKFLDSEVMRDHVGRLNLYITLLEDHIGVEPTSADEANNLTIGDKD